MRIALITDAWLPQVNGVTTTLSRCRDEIERVGHSVGVVSPDLFRTVPCPRYPHIRLALWPGGKFTRLVDAVRPQAVHIATEGPLGLAGRRYCRRRGLPFTTSLHTKFPEYLRVYAGIPESLTYRLMRWFHGGAERTLVPTRSVQEELRALGFDNTVLWMRAVDTELFRPRNGDFYELPKPIFLYVGRVAAEKNIEAFLDCRLPGSKVVVGDGPAKAELERRFPDVHWAGFRFGEDLAQHYAGGDVLVFPSRTDTFGVVMLEANACGVPVAAFPVTGPIDVVQPGTTGALSDDLEAACLEALEIDRSSCRAFAEQMSWQRCAEMLFANLAAFDGHVDGR
jgi:glycosyltransferase involved in cell wall biosynthesis